MGANRPVSKLLTGGLMAVLIVLTATLLADGSDVVAQSGGTLRVQPSKTQVAPGETFTVEIIQSTDVPTLAAQTNVFFNAGVLQIVSAEPGDPYIDAQFLAGKDVQTVEEAVAEANSTGALLNLATFYLPGTGFVDPGDQVFARLTMRAAAPGSTDISLGEHRYLTEQILSGEQRTTIEAAFPIGLLPDPPDGQGTLIPVSVVPATITVVGGAAAVTPTPPPAAASATASPTATATKTPKPSKTPSKSGSGKPGGPSLAIDPATVEADPGAEFEFSVVAQSPKDITGAQFSLEYETDVLTITDIELGEDWEVSKEPDFTEEIEVANEEGTLAALLVVQKSSADPIPPGEVTVVTITARAADEDGESVLQLLDGALIDEDGKDVPTGSVNSGTAIIGEGDSDGGGLGSIALIGGGLLLIGALGGGAAFAYRSIRRNRWEE